MGPAGNRSVRNMIRRNHGAVINAQRADAEKHPVLTTALQRVGKRANDALLNHEQTERYKYECEMLPRKKTT